MFLILIIIIVIKANTHTSTSTNTKASFCPHPCSHSCYFYSHSYPYSRSCPHPCSCTACCGIFLFFSSFPSLCFVLFFCLFLPLTFVFRASKSRIHPQKRLQPSQKRLNKEMLRLPLFKPLTQTN